MLRKFFGFSRESGEFCPGTMNYGEIQKEVMNFLNDPAEEDFEDLALAVFAYQFAHNPGYRAYCEALDRTPDLVTSWSGIPALPCDAFKCQPPPFCGDPTTAERCFLSSGTTGEIRSHHYFRELETYRRAILAGWRAGALPELVRCAFVSRPPGSHPESSLMFMMETLGDSARDSAWLLGPDGSPRYPDLAAGPSPLVLFGTTINLLHYLGQAPDGWRVPEDAWVFQTGGAKGLEGRIDPSELSTLFTTAGIAADRIINEYGMTELSSQAYAVGSDALHRCPPWMRVRVIDPETGSEQTAGGEGYLELLDLANLGSVLAVRTQDIATAHDDQSFALRGRDPGALPRGCSRSADAAVALS